MCYFVNDVFSRLLNRLHIAYFSCGCTLCHTVFFFRATPTETRSMKSIRYIGLRSSQIKKYILQIRHLQYTQSWILSKYRAGEQYNDRDHCEQTLHHISHHCWFCFELSARCEVRSPIIPVFRHFLRERWNLIWDCVYVICERSLLRDDKILIYAYKSWRARLNSITISLPPLNFLQFFQQYSSESSTSAKAVSIIKDLLIGSAYKIYMIEYFVFAKRKRTNASGRTRFPRTQYDIYWIRWKRVNCENQLSVSAGYDFSLAMTS